MRTAETIAYSIRHLLKKLNVKTDDLKDEYLYNRIPSYANFWMQRSYDQNRTVEPSWILNLGKVSTENVNSGDDPNVLNGSVVLAKYVLPQILSLNGKPFIKVYNGLRTEGYTRIENFDMFFAIYRADRRTLEKYPVYIVSGGNIYVYPNKGLQIQLVPQNPFECDIKSELYNPITKEKMFSKEELRKFTIFDRYPISPSIEYMMLIDFTEKEFGINRDLIVDKMQDGNDETNKR